MALKYNEKKRKTLFDAQVLKHIKQGQNDEALSILKDLNYWHLTDSNNETLLHHAATYGNKEFAQHLISLGANVDAQNHIGRTPLMLAVISSNEEIVQLLLGANADVLITDFDSECVLEKVYGSFEEKDNIKNAFANKVTLEYLRNSQYINSENFQNNYPLYAFIFLKNAAVTRFLLEKGCPVDATDVCVRTALHAAVGEMYVENVRILTENGANVNAEDEDEERPLTCITNFDSKDEVLEIVKILINAGAELIDYEYSRILVKSILSNGHKELIRLLSQHMDMHFIDDCFITPLHYMCENKNPGIFEELRNINCNVNICYSNGNSTLLHHAARLGNPNAVRFLLQRGADVNAKDDCHRTPLCMAIDPIESLYTLSEYDWERRLDCIEQLYGKGADPQILTEYNKRYIPVFTRMPSDTIVKLIKPILNLLALREASGRTIEQFMLSEIQKRNEFQEIFNSCRRQLEEMKKIKIDDGVNLFDFLIDNQVALYAQNKELIVNRTDMMKGWDSDSYYHRRLQQRFLKLTQLVAINEVFVKFYNVSVIQIAAKIVDYL